MGYNSDGLIRVRQGMKRDTLSRMHLYALDGLSKKEAEDIAKALQDPEADVSFATNDKVTLTSVVPWVSASVLRVMPRNCQSCGAPRNLSRLDCDYCGTPY